MHVWLSPFTIHLKLSQHYSSAMPQYKTKSSVHTAIFKMDNQQRLFYSTWNSAQCYVAAWVGGESGGGGYTYMLSPFTVHLK